MTFSSHPTVKAYHENKKTYQESNIPIPADEMKQIAMENGADDAGIIELARDPVLEYKSELLGVMHDTKSVMVLAFRINQAPLRSLAHSVADLEFKRATGNIKNIVGRIVDQLAKAGIKAVGMPPGFPMEMKRWPDRIWLTNDKLFAIEAGLGHMGINRLVLHPRYGGAVFFGNILLAQECDEYDQPLDYNPCIECGLCVKACPTGAVKRNDDFDFTSCYSHNYRERIGGFLNWIEQIVKSKKTADYRKRVSDAETFSMWQNLSIGSQTRCDRCMAVCPAGEMAIGEFIEDQKTYMNHYLKPFMKLEEVIYAVKGSDAEQHVLSRFPDKTVKNISNGLRPISIAMFLESLPRMFQTNQSKGMNAVYHFSFTGRENAHATVTIKEKKIRVEEGINGSSDIHVTADSQTWIRFLAKEANLLVALVTRKIKIKGSPKLMKDFARCFPG